MDPVAVTLVACALMLGGALGGAMLRRALPQHHLDTHAKDVVRLGAGLLATVSGLLLGLLINSAHSKFESQHLLVRHLASDIILLDQLLIRYGAEAKPARQLLREGLLPLADEIWGSEAPSAFRGQAPEANVAGAQLFMALHELSPRNETQMSIRSQMIQTMMEIAKARLGLYEQADSALPIPFLVMLLFWLTAIFASFSLFSPLNATSIGALLVIAASASGAIFLIFEMNRPFSGLLQIPRSTIADVLRALGG